ncbi:MAG: STY4851/ECs_5259 family protein [Methylococcaceae bacterium]
MTSNEGFNQLKTMNPLSFWIRGMLHNRDLEKPNKQLLYLYHLDKDEYEELKEILIKQGKEELFNHVTISAPAAFTLFSSEWYRREYDGSTGWSWKGIWDALGYKLEAHEIETVLVRGLEKYWKRPIRRYDRGRNFLGSVFSEGGLPFQLLQQDHNSFSGALKGVLSQYHRRELFGQSTAYIVKQYSQYFPSAFQEDVTVDLIAEIIDRLMDYVKSYQLDQQENPSQFLDEKAQGWRNSFPIPLDQNTGNALLDSWLNDATEESKNRETQDSTDTNCCHFLVNNTDGCGFRIKSRITLPERINLNIKKEDLSNTRLEIQLMEGNHVFANLGIVYAQSDQDAVFFRNRKRMVEGFKEEYDRNIRLIVKDAGKEIYDKPLDNSLLAICDMPLVFVEKNKEWQYFGAASVRLKVNEARLVLVKGMKLENQASQQELLGQLGEDFNVLEIRESVVCILGSNIFKIQLNSEYDAALEYCLDGNLLSWETLPRITYIGIPKIKLMG